MERLDEQTAPRPATHPAPPHPEDPQPVYGRPGAEAERPGWSTRRTAAVTAVAAAAVLGVGGVAVAYSGSDANTAAATQGPGGGQPAPGTGRFPGTGSTGLAAALHGTFVTQGTDGTYVTQVMQTGEVTAVSATSIAVRSADGYARTYTLSSGTSVNGGQAQVSAIATGHTVTVVASEDGAASTVLDQSLLTGGFPGQAPPDGTT